ncbi:hypothetical protein OF001_U130057 [Pseudomonas sp. OF001]|nr:hypothetical protein OF001_U130057 [Pseudomonas sp. OF001]
MRWRRARTAWGQRMAPAAGELLTGRNRNRMCRRHSLAAPAGFVPRIARQARQGALQSGAVAPAAIASGRSLSRYSAQRPREGPDNDTENLP